MMNDLRYGVRSLLKAPGFTAAAVLSLALGLGLNTAIFTLVNAVLLRPLPVARPGELVQVYTSAPGTAYSSTSWPDYLDLRERSTAFSGLVAHTLALANVSHEGRASLVIAEAVSANYFDALGVPPALGRVFTPADDAPGAPTQIVLSHGYWQRQFAGLASVLGQRIKIRGRDYTVAGIAPASFTGVTPGVAPELWIPAALVEDVEPVGINENSPSTGGTTRLDTRGQRWLFVKGRLKPGTSAAQAQANVSAVMAQLARDYPVSNTDRIPTVLPVSALRFHPMIDGVLAPAAIGVMGAVGLVLLVACANVANMLLARGRARAREVAIRTAIGASRARLVRQLLTESLLLSFIGGAAGLLLAHWALRVLMNVQLPVAVAITWQLGVDVRVFAFAFLATLVTGLLFGLLPAWRASRTNLVSDLKNQASVSEGAARWFQLRHALVVAQVALCVVLLVAAGLLVRSLGNARATDVGFDADSLAVATVDLGMHRYTPDRGAAFFSQAVDRLARLPEVRSVALAERLPFTPNIHSTTIYVAGATDERGVTFDSTRVDDRYFQTIGVPVVEGRGFDTRDTPQSPRVAVVSAAMAKRYWPGASAVGRRFRLRGPAGREIEVIGVAADYKVRTVGEAPRPYVHYARAQSYSPSVSFLVSARVRAADAVALLRRELTALEPELLMLENQTMAAQLETALLAPRASASLLGALGAFALVLASVGLYGVIAFGVSRRTREIGIRMALGAAPTSVLSLVVREGMVLTAIGIGLGLILAAAVARLMSGVLYGISSIDPVTYTVMPLVLLVVALAANLIPALRAARIDPLTALRQE